MDRPAPGVIPPLGPSQRPRRARVHALHWIAGLAAVGYAIWCWDDFDGPFRRLVDLQVGLTGRFYWEPLAVALLLVGLLLPAMLVADLLGLVTPRLSARAWGWLFMLAAVGVSGLALARAWRLWTAPSSGAMHRYAPIRVLDLDRLGPELMPPGVVRVVGGVDRRQRVWLSQQTRGDRLYQPLRGRRRAAEDLPRPVLATCYDRYRRDCLPEVLDGWLVPSRVDDRDSYRLRRAGLVTRDFYLLYPGLPKTEGWVEDGPGDPGEAVAVVVYVSLFWLTILISVVATRSSAQAPRSSADCPAPRDADAQVVNGGSYRARPYLFSLLFAAGVFVFLSVLGVFVPAIRLISDFIP